MTAWTLEQMAARAAADIPDGAYVNLGIGLPERVADHVPSDREFVLHSENGILGMGPRPPLAEEDMDLINAGKKPVTLVAGGAYFHHADSFGMIRGGHVDVCILGAFEVAANGDIANWSTGPDGAPAVGGAMDLAAGAKKVRVITAHTTRSGAPKLLRGLTLPATGRSVIDRVYTDLAVLDPAIEGFRLVELAPGVQLDDIRRKTGAPILV
ncbi:3-oxoacid CoA-transferase subunit B [Caulobacter sp. RL271]|jgi:3-oxoadipate CoA-transferase beta subunit|uniref:3-oxoacid CoA-transferase subunit B n=1 Tax=Caulobacter segnis TaxID=88688 RepID=A0ABY4ZST0_9CAUL|nr:3-oxoacid CoA-transferase subunit B [Caulobacter segnis]USQ95439.1 3-oxoacid CoA-transferase subunit B [Caulobacter segnis]